MYTGYMDSLDILILACYLNCVIITSVLYNKVLLMMITFQYHISKQVVSICTVYNDNMDIVTIYNRSIF